MLSSRVIDINCSDKEASAPCAEGGGGRGRGRGLFQSGIPQITLAIAFAALCVGCHTGTLKDPNDVATAGLDTPNVIMVQLQVASDSLTARKDRKEINNLQYRILMARVARSYIDQATNKTLTDENASAWAQVYFSARDWKDAEPAYQRAVKVEGAAPKSDFQTLGKWVGDSLGLSSVQAHLGKVHDAIVTARSVFGVTAKAKAPILTSILYDIVPAASRHGASVELGDLLKDAIKQHEQVIVDPSTNGGRDFLLARPHHIQHAWEEAAIIYEAAGRHDLAVDAINQSHAVAASSIKL